MSHSYRIGSQIGPYDPFWVQVREAVSQKAQQLDLELIPIEIAGRPETLSPEEQIGIVEELLAQELDALICWNIPEKMIIQVLEGGLPAIYLSESKIHHTLFVSPQGLYEVGKMIGDYFAEQLGGRGRVLCVGGLSEPGGEDGGSRIAGFKEALDPFPEISINQIPTYWRYDQALPQIEAVLRQIPSPIDDIFCLSDSIALAARDSLKAIAYQMYTPSSRESMGTHWRWWRLLRGASTRPSRHQLRISAAWRSSWLIRLREESHSLITSVISPALLPRKT